MLGLRSTTILVVICVVGCSAPKTTVDDFGDGVLPPDDDWVPMSDDTNGTGDAGTGDTGIGCGTSSVTSGASLTIVLTWTEATDQDLHLTFVDGGDLLFHETVDCHWLNCTQACLDDASCTVLAWFADAPLSGSNPELLSEELTGPGVEEIEIAELGEGTYRIYVHFYTLVNRTDTPTPTSIEILVDDTLEARFDRVLNKDELWWAAELHRSSDGVISIHPAPCDGEGMGSVDVAPYHVDPQEGYNFGG